VGLLTVTRNVRKLVGNLEGKRNEEAHIATGMKSADISCPHMNNE